MKTVIWDFNGTILDDFPLCLNVINQMLRRRNLPALTADAYLSVFDFPVKNYYAQVGFDFKVEPFPILAREYMDLYQPASFNCQLKPGVPETLAALKDNGIQQVLLSATQKEFLLAQIEHFNLTGYFQAIVGLNDILGQSKLEMARGWFAQNSLKPSQTVLVGDTTHDYEVANALKCNCILISGGHNSSQRLLETGACVLTEIAAAALI